MSLKQHMISQFGRPRGIGGRVSGWVMAHRSSNRRRNLWVVSLLGIQPTDRVLEVGFGPGVAIRQVARLAGRVYGVDHSELMVRRVRRYVSDVVCASVADLPDFGAPLDVVYSVNSIGFWPQPVERLRELRDALRPGGRIALATQPRMPGVTTEQAAQQLRDLLAAAGFVNARTEILDLSPAVACVIAVSPSGPGESPAFGTPGPLV